MQQTAAQSALKPDIGMRDITSAVLGHSSLVGAPVDRHRLRSQDPIWGKQGERLKIRGFMLLFASFLCVQSRIDPRATPVGLASDAPMQG